MKAAKLLSAIEMDVSAKFWGRDGYNSKLHLTEERETYADGFSSGYTQALSDLRKAIEKHYPEFHNELVG